MQAVKIGWVGQPFAMARNSEANAKGKKPRSRLKKEERKSLVESFISKYRNENNGNFPSLYLTHKEVGGSFYTVREILRELIQENRVLAPGSSHSQVFNLEYSEERAQPPLGTLSINPASTLDLKIDGHESDETGGGQINDLHVIEESEKFDKTITVSSNLTASGDVVASSHEYFENKDVAFSQEESSLSDSNFSIDSMQTVILDSDICNSKSQVNPLHDISSIRKVETVVAEQLSVLDSGSPSSISDSICVGEGQNSSVTENTKVTSYMCLEESSSAEISTENRQPTYIKKGDAEDLQDGLSESSITEDILSSSNSSSCINGESGLKFEDEGSMSSTSFEIENSSVIEESNTSFMCLEESSSAEISTENGQPTYIKKGDAEDLQDGLSKSSMTEDILSSFNSSSCINGESGLKFEDKGSMSSTSFEIENSSVIEESNTSFTCLEESISSEISTLNNMQQTHINKGDAEDLQDGLSKLIETEDILSSFYSSSCMDSESGLRFEDEGSVSSTSFKVENGSITEEKRTNVFATMSPLSLEEISQIHSPSSNITVQEVGTNIGISVSEISSNDPPHIHDEIESLHLPVEDALKNPIAFSEETTEQRDSHVKSEISEIIAPSSMKGSSSSLLEAVESDSSEGTPHGPDVAKETNETNPIVSALKGFLRALVNFFYE